jgi:hypothetical protein
VNAVVERIMLATRPNPRKVRLAKMGLEVPQTVLEDGFGIIGIERFEKIGDLLLLLRRE